VFENGDNQEGYIISIRIRTPNIITHGTSVTTIAVTYCGSEQIDLVTPIFIANSPAMSNNKYIINTTFPMPPDFLVETKYFTGKYNVVKIENHNIAIIGFGVFVSSDIVIVIAHNIFSNF